jgi:hypothetical protein
MTDVKRSRMRVLVSHVVISHCGIRSGRQGRMGIVFAAAKVAIEPGFHRPAEEIIHCSLAWRRVGGKGRGGVVIIEAPPVWIRKARRQIY